MEAAELRATALGHKLKSIRVEAMKNGSTMINRGTKDLGNAFYADWVIGYQKGVAVWHNEEKKGDVVEALMGMTWVLSNCKNMSWAGDLLSMQIQLETSMREWEKYWEKNAEERLAAIFPATFTYAVNTEEQAEEAENRAREEAADAGEGHDKTKGRAKRTKEQKEHKGIKKDKGQNDTKGKARTAK